MPKSDALKIAEIQAHQAMLHDLVTNPVAELIAGYVVIAYLNKGEGSWWESVSGIDFPQYLQSLGLVAIITAQQLAPVLPDVLPALGGLGGISKALTAGSS